MQQFVEGRIKIKDKKDESELMLNAIYLLLRKLKGNSLHDILKMSMPQFYCLIQMTSKEIKEINQEIKKNNKSSKKR